MEKALQWVPPWPSATSSGTESRLNTIFDLLRQIVFGTETDPQAKIEELRRQQRQIEDEIARIEAGDLGTLDSAGVRDRYQQFSATARELLADFREVEENFRKLDRQLREKIAGWHGGKGELLDDVLGSRESIAGSDQGRSFQAFYDFLLSQARQEELAKLLQGHGVAAWHGGRHAERDPRLRQVHHDWLDAAERTQATVRQLSEQLRRFLDDQVWFENRRVIDLLRNIEARALQLRDAPTPDPVGLTMEIDASPADQAADGAPALHPHQQAPPRQRRHPPGRGRRRDRPGGAFRAGLRGSRPAARRRPPALRAPPQVGLADLIAAAPLTQGAAELVTYLTLRDDAFAIVYDEARTEQIGWNDPDGSRRTATLPRVTFTRRGR